MTYSVDQAWIDQFSDNIMILSQQRNSLFENTVTAGGLQGEYKFFERIADISMTARSASKESTTYTDVTHTKRAVDFDDYDVTLYVDKRDLKRVATDPQSAYIESAVAAWKRTLDDVIIASFFADAKTGRATGGSFGTATFDTTNQTIDVKFQEGDPVGAGAGTSATRLGLTKAKILKARSIILGNHALAPGERIYCAISPDEEIQLLGIPEFASSDYRALAGSLPYDLGLDPNGYIGDWLGITWLRSTRLPTVDPASADNDYRRIPMWVPSGVGMVRGDAPSIEIMPNPEKKMLRTIHIEGSVGSVRIEEKKVVEIRTKHTADAS